MNTFVSDNQTVAETSGVLWSTIQAGTVELLVTLTNSGVNTINYIYEEYNGTAWAAMDVQGSLLYNTLMSGQTKTMVVSSSYPQVRLTGNASGGSVLNFSISRYADRASGGAIPLLFL